MKNRPRRFVLYCLVCAFIAIIQLFPRKWTLAIARVVGRLVFHVVPRQRRLVLENLRFAWKEEKTEAELVKIAKGVFENMAMTAVDFVLLPRVNAKTVDDWVTYDDEFELAKKLLEHNKGILMLTAHLGNWELLAAAYKGVGFDGAALGRRIYYKRYDDLLVRLRQGAGVRTIYRDNSPREMLKVLASGQILGMLADQDVDSVEGIFVDFFGHPAYTPTAPVKLAMAAKVPLMPAFMIREGTRYRLAVEEPIRVEAGDSKEKAVKHFTEAWSKIVEKYIRAYPEQWVWMHRRWKTRPEQLAAKKEAELLQRGS